MITIGIDFSIRFPAACITKNFNNFKWIACVNTNIPKSYRKFLENVQFEFKNVEIIYLDSTKIKKTSYSATERSKLVNYSNLIDAFTDSILREIGKSSDLVISVEGISYGAKGNALLDICQSTGMMRKSVLDRIILGKSEKLFIFSPGELKNSIGAKGNASKLEVFNNFMKRSASNSSLSLTEIINKYSREIVSDKEIKSPFMDMIDSYLAVLTVHELLKNN